MSVNGDGTGGNETADVILAQPSPELAELREKLELLKQINELQVPSGSKPVMRVKVPEGSYNMSPTEFRTFKKDCLTYRELTKYSDYQVVLQIRLRMDADLKRIIDTNHSEWDTLTVEEAMEVVGKVVNDVSNPVVYRKQFDSLIQNKDESIREFVTKLRVCALDCEFRCPFDATHDLTDYFLINRIRTGLYDNTLQQEVLQKHSMLNSVDLLVNYCENYESTKKDRMLLKSQTSSSPVGVVNAAEGLDEEEIVAAISAYKRQKRAPYSQPGYRSKVEPPQEKMCTYCGYPPHTKGQPCPANGKFCLKCGKRGHFSRVCRSSQLNNREDSQYPKKASAVFINDICAGTSDTLPRLSMLVGEDFAPHAKQLDIIPDTGAEVTVAGERFLDHLKIKKSMLNPPRKNLKHVAGGVVTVIGSCMLSFEVYGQHIVEEVYFVPNIKSIFLSITGCRGLKLIHSNFPYVINENINAVSVGNNSVETKSNHKPAPRVWPEVMPFEPVEENIDLLETWFLETFSTVFDTKAFPLQVMSGKEQHIHLKENAVPYAVHSPIPVPNHWSNEVKQLLGRNVQLGIIEKVPVNEPVEWCTRMVTVKKKDGSPRITADYQHLNEHVLRETYPNAYPFDIVNKIPVHSYKSVADAFQGYHQVKLDTVSSNLTTFITEDGRYRYLRNPQGLSSAGDAYSHRYGEILIDVPRKCRVIDDSLLHDKSIKDAFYHTYDFLVICESNGVTLNPTKFKFARKEVDFLGYTLGWDTFSPSKDTLSAINNFPMPAKPSITDIRAWFGLVNQLSPFLATSAIMEPFRELLKPSASKGNLVYWDKTLQDLFEKSKDVICEEAAKGLAYFDITKNIIVITDWSTKGIAFTILQQHCSCDTKDNPFCCSGGWKLVLCSSRHLQDREKTFAAVEGEALAVKWCFQKARNFLLGCPSFVLLTDHKPLVKILSNKSLSSITNSRIFRMKQPTLQYTFTVKHLEGRNMFATDTLSRYPSKHPEKDDIDFMDELEVASVAAVSLCASEHLSVTLSEVREAASDDQAYQLLLNQVQNNSFAHNRKDEHPSTKPFYHVRNRLSIVDGLLTYSYEGDDIRLIIPVKLQSKIVKNLHSAHQGSDSILKRARQCIYWPGMDRDINQSCASCKLCIQNAPSQTKEELIPSPIPHYPFQHVVADIFHLNGHDYIAYADRLTGWIEVSYFQTSPRSCDIIDTFRSLFHRFGVPEEVSMDGGSNISSAEIITFLNRWGCKSRQSSAYYPQSNGRAEAAVKSMKRVIGGSTGRNGSINNDNITKALLQYRNTPLKDVGKSPAQLLLGRKLRDVLPQPSSELEVSPEWKFFIRQREKAMLDNNVLMKQKYDHGSVRSYDQIPIGTAVVCQNVRNKKWDRKGVVVEVCNFRQYKIKMEGSGRISLRNRIHLRPLLNIKPHIPNNMLPSITKEFCTPQETPSITSSQDTVPTLEVSSQDIVSSPEIIEVQQPPAITEPTTSVGSAERRYVCRSGRRVNAPDRYGEWTT